MIHSPKTQKMKQKSKYPDLLSKDLNSRSLFYKLATSNDLSMKECDYLNFLENFNEVDKNKSSKLLKEKVEKTKMYSLNVGGVFDLYNIEESKLKLLCGKRKPSFLMKPSEFLARTLIYQNSVKDSPLKKKSGGLFANLLKSRRIKGANKLAANKKEKKNIFKDLIYRKIVVDKNKILQEGNSRRKSMIISNSKMAKME